MKKVTTLLFAVVLAVMVVTGMVTPVSAAIERGDYYYIPAGTMISELAMISMSEGNQDTALGRLEYNLMASFGSDISYLNQNLNEGAGGNNIFLGWVRTDNPYSAITGIRLVEDTSTDPAVTITDDKGIEWTLVNYGKSGYFTKEMAHDFGKVNLNAGNKGDSIYMYYTTDKAFGPPLNDVEAIVTDKNTMPTDPGEKAEAIKTENGTWLNVNQGAGNTGLYLYAESNAEVTKLQELKDCLATANSYRDNNNYIKQNDFGTLCSRAERLIYLWGNNTFSYGSATTNENVHTVLDALQQELSNLQGKIYFDASTNGGGMTGDTTRTFKIGTAQSASFDLSGVTASKDGYEFIGWSTDPNAKTGSKGAVTVRPGDKFYAIFKKNITVHFVMAGSSIAKRADIYNNETEAEFNVPSNIHTSSAKSEDGRVFPFAGWRTDKTVKPESFSSRLTKISAGDGAIFYAVYKGKANVVFDTDEGSPIDTIIADVYMNTSKELQGIYFTLPDEIPDKRGYRFLHWEDSAGWDYDPGEQLRTSEDMTLTAIYDRIRYNVTAESSNDTYGTVTGAGTFNSLEQVTVTATPNDHYKFVEWQENGSQVSTDAAYTFELTENRTLTAVFEPEKYTITYQTNGGTFASLQSEQYAYGIGEVLPDGDDIQRTGYGFMGWYKQPDFSDEVCTEIDAQTYGDQTFYAKWEINRYDVVFDAQGHGTTPSQQIIEHGGKATDPGVLSEDGFRFVGWYKADGVTQWDFENDTVLGDTTIYAKWIPLYKVNFDLQGFGDAIPQQIVEDGSKASEPTDPQTTHYTFEGWFVDPGCTDAWEFDTDTVTAHITLYAKWVIKVYNVSFDVQAHGATPAAQGIPYNQKVQNPGNLTAAGYQFGGWFTESGCLNQWDFETDTVDGNMTLYAKWTPYYPVSFAMQGHGSPVSAQTILQGNKVTEPTEPTDEYYYFIGWYKEPECVNVWDFDTDTVSGNTTLYAKWERITYTVTLPTSKEYVAAAVSGFASPVNKGEDYSFTVTVGNMYDDSKMIVKANDVMLTPVGGVYTVTDIREAQVITVEGIVLKPVPIMLRLENFATTTGAFLDEAYYAREARAGDIVTLKISTTELGDKYGLDYKKLTVKYEVEGAVQLGSSYDYHGNPIYKDGIATDFMLSEGFNKMVAHVYYAGSYVGAFEPFFTLI